MPGNPVQNLFEEVLRRSAQGETSAMCTIVATRGSCPQAAGARMLVAADGSTLGTLGGGCVEAEVRRRALEMITSGKSELLSFSLDHDYGWDDGLICGGEMDVHVDLVRDEPSTKKYRDVLEALAINQSCEMTLQFSRGDKAARFVDTIDPPARLLIAGAGHVGQALAKLAVDLGFDVTVVDDRPDFLTEQRFPGVDRKTVSDIAADLSDSNVDEQTYIVIVTRGHQRDGQVLAAVVKSAAKYVGLIGSKRKIKAIFDDLIAQGVSAEAIARVHAPIGLEIGAVTVSEIAISIAAELVAVKRGRGNREIAPMKMETAELNRWLTRASRGDS